MIPASRPYQSNAGQRLAEFLANDWLSPRGPLSQEFAQMLDRRYDALVTLTNSGTSALEAALYALGRVFGTTSGHVVVPGYTCPDVAIAVIKAGFTPLFCDVEGPLNRITERTLGRVLCNRRDIVGVIPIHMYGAAPAPEVYHLARSHGVFILSDMAEGLGSAPGGHDVLTLCDAAITSLRGDKPFPVGTGGVVLTRHVGIHGIAQALVGINSPGGYWRLYSYDKALSYEFPELLAAYGLAQFELYPEYIRQRHVTVGKYERLGMPRIFEPHDVPWKYPVTVRDSYTAWEFFKQRGIEVSPPLQPLNTLPFLGKYQAVDLSGCRDAARHTVALPILSDMTDDEILLVWEAYSNLRGEEADDAE